MPWVRALLREQKIYARADAEGALVADNGRVEIRYKPHDGRRYEARAANLTIVDATPLPDSTCGEASTVEKSAADAPTAAPARPGGGGRITKAQALAAGPPKAPDGAIIVYCDGACSGNPGPAGLGAVVIDGGARVELSEYLGLHTNNIAELTAVLRALGEIPEGRHALIHTDSQYSIGVLQKGWKAKANVALVAELRAVLKTRPLVKLVYVPGHSGVALNERADKLAREAVEGRKTRRTELPSKPVTPPLP
ncbi:MAG: ribonuclease H [Byssovorax sp.]